MITKMLLDHWFLPRRIAHRGEEDDEDRAVLRRRNQRKSEDPMTVEDLVSLADEVKRQAEELAKQKEEGKTEALKRGAKRKEKMVSSQASEGEGQCSQGSHEEWVPSQTVPLLENDAPKPKDPAECSDEKIYTSPAGEKYHMNRHCHGLRNASRVQESSACSMCVPRHWRPGQNVWLKSIGDDFHTRQHEPGQIRMLKPCLQCADRGLEHELFG